MLFKSPVFSQASGSIAGIVYSRNAGGMYTRARAMPTNPNTENQQTVRNAMSTLVVAWQNTLTATQRENWATYAFNTPTLNRIGEPTSKSGQQMFLRSNVPRIAAGGILAADAPTIFDLGDLDAVGPITPDESAQTIAINFNDTEAWVDEDDSYLLVYQSRPQNPTRNFGKGPFQLLTMITGSSILAPTSPVTVNTLFPVTAGQKVFFQVRVSRADGRLSAKQNPTGIVVA